MKLLTSEPEVNKAFELTWEKLDLPTQQVAEFLSLFSANPISWELIESASRLLKWADSDTNAALQQLYKCQLIKQVEAKAHSYIIIAPSVREFLREKLTASKQAENIKQAFVGIMLEIAREIPESPTRLNIDLLKDTISHLEAAANWWDGYLLQVQTSLGNNQPDVATSLNNLAQLYCIQGCYQQAEPLDLQIIKLLKQLGGEKHPDIATILSNLSALYYAQGRYNEAETLCEQALELTKCLLGEKHPDVATSLNNLAEIYCIQGRYCQAEPLYLQALQLRREFGDHLDVAASINNLAGFYCAQGRLAEAEQGYLQALEMTKRLLGKHPDVATNLNNLALLYKSQGRLKEAESLYLQALKLRKHLLGSNHPDVASSLNNLAGLYQAQGRLEQAKRLYLQALNLSEQLLGIGHPTTFIFRKNLAILQTEIAANNSWLGGVTKKFLKFV